MKTTKDLSNGGTRVCVWAGPGRPPDDPSLWHDANEVEDSIRKLADNAAKLKADPFGPVAVARVWARRNAAPGHVAGIRTDLAPKLPAAARTKRGRV